ncbi:MAG TPA: hypothetical protein VEB00_11655 [Clostridia bacterium]|nr:hypothetical protein [Clostridia bacterium]
MDIIGRYIYAVTKELPGKQREDIEKELRTLIEDILEQYEENEPYEAKVEKALLSLGDPKILAENYRGSKQYLIGPQNYENYINLLKIVLGAVFLGVSVAVGIGSIFAGQQSAAAIFTDYLATLFSGLLQGSAWVTIIFAIAERKGVNVMDGKSVKADWSIAELPVVPEKKAVISPAESIAAILFSTIFITIIYFAPQIFAVYIPGNTVGPTVIPIFDITVISGYRWLFAAVFILSICKEVLKLVSGRWTLKVSLLYSALSVVATVLVLIVFSNPSIWNPNFSAELLKHLDFSFGFINILGQTNTGMILIILAASILDISTVLYKGIRYNIK